MAPSNLHVNNERKTTQDHAQQNQLTINDLPPEVLHDVFFPVAGFYLGHYTRLLRLRMVCKYWKEVIDSTPELWAPIKSQLHPELQAMIIRNSRNHPLSVWYDESVWERDPAKEAKMAAFSSLMEPSASRWQGLYYHRGLTSESDIWMFALPLHNLRWIEIDAPTWREQRHTLDAPKLSHVNIIRFSLNWRSLSGLRFLSLTITDPTLNELIAMLQASPDLQHLSLQKTRLKDESEGTPTSSKVLLPHLSYLRIGRASTRSICLLLGSIETSSLQTFAVDVQYKYESEDCTPLCESVGRYIGAFPLPQSEEQPFVSIRAWRREIEFSLGERKISVCDYTWDNDNGSQSRLAYLASVIKCMDSRVRREVKALNLTCHVGGEEIGEYLRTIHFRFPQIDQILLKENEIDIVAVSQHFSAPLRLELAEGWLLPKLTKLELELSYSTKADLIDKVAQLVMQRKAAEGAEDITELRINSTPGAIGPGIVELFRQSVASFELTERD